jgi:hypothetical protein
LNRSAVKKRLYGKASAAPTSLTREIDRLAVDATTMLGWPRKQAEFIARRYVKGLRPNDAASKLAGIASLAEVHGHGKNTPKSKPSRPAPGEMSPLNARAKPKTAKERMERALGPDNGVRRRGGSPVLQGGSPGLGRRR